MSLARLAVTAGVLVVVLAALAASADRAAASSTVALEHGTLTIKGDAAGDTLALRARPSAPRILEIAAARGWRVYFLGGRPGVAEAAAARLRDRFPRLQIAGTRDGYFDFHATRHFNQRG